MEEGDAGPACELELVHGEQGIGQVGNGKYTHEAQSRERVIGRRAHREVIGMLGKARGRPERLDFAGDLTGRRGPCRRFLAARVDSSCRDDPSSKAKSMASLACRGRAPDYGAMARWMRLFSGAWRTGENEGRKRQHGGAGKEEEGRG
jgi:hypothetical protein